MCRIACQQNNISLYLFTDSGQCIPIKCINGVAPENCTALCNVANFKTICRPRTGNCLCLRPVGNGRWDLVSPDEVPTLYKPTESATDQDETYSTGLFAFFTYNIPVSKLNVTQTQTPAVDDGHVEREELLDEIVNVHEGRLFWDFCYILTGLLLLMVGLILYEIYMCRKMASGSQSNGIEPLINKGFIGDIFTVGNGNEKTDAPKITQ